LGTAPVGGRNDGRPPMPGQGAMAAGQNVQEEPMEGEEG